VRGRLGAFTLAALVVALGFNLLFESTLTRIVGVASMLAFIVAGVFLIASPGFLDAEE
jgi:hypothetical protein